ncbi:MAG: hypothetical protein ABR606_02600 [Vicinamibacterales bacterium]
MPLKTVSLVGALCLLAGWLMASLLLPPVASLQSNPSTAARRAPSTPPSATAPYAERLRLKLRESPAAPTPRRNPFTFERAMPGRAGAARLVSGIADPPPAAAESPTITLAGIATASTADGVERTAVLSAAGDVVLARAGDTVVGGYRVVRVDEAAVTLTGSSGLELILHLR